MPRLIVTSDGSHSLAMDDVTETYHSIHGAMTESMHVFITNGLRAIGEQKNSINILEVGLGTGLNCLLTLRDSIENDLEVKYTALEPFPLEKELTDQLNYGKLLGAEYEVSLNLIHSSSFNETVKLTDKFSLLKLSSSLVDHSTEDRYDLIYFDAFAPAIDPHLWSPEVFKKVYSVMKNGSLLVTYCAKGSVKRAMKEAGFVIERLEGPPGKREMTRARKVLY
jgi:tRNA U34 5-methylaminomethyl-2-thiouridine-forming methyltransferase MnmC